MPYSSKAVWIGPSGGVWVRMGFLEERRLDPEDGEWYSYREIASYYGAIYTKREIASYWYDEMQPQQNKGKGKGKAKTERVSRQAADSDAAGVSSMATEAGQGQCGAAHETENSVDD